MTPTCVAPRHVDALLFFNFFLRTSSARGGGGALPDFFFLFLFPWSADHEWDWPPCEVVFFGLATNALNVRNNNNNNSCYMCDHTYKHGLVGGNPTSAL